MTEQEYKSQLKTLSDSYEAAKKKLHIMFASANRIYKVGDIIKDNHQIIVIEKFGTHMGFDQIPIPKYIGKMLKKDLTPIKSGDIGAVYGNNNTELLKKA